MGIGSFPGVKSGRVVTLTPHPTPLLVPCSRKIRAIPLLPLWAVRPVQGCTLCIPTWRRRVQRRVCAFTGCSAVLPVRNKFGWSCAPYVMHLNEVTAVKTWGRLIMWQTGCLSLLPSVIRQVPCQIQAFLQTFWSYLSVAFGCTWWEVFTIASSVVAIRLTAGRLTSPGIISSRSEISNQRAFDFCDESGKEKDPPNCRLTRLYNPHELKLIQMACFRGTKNDTATTWQKQSESWEGAGLFQFGVKNQLQHWTLAFPVFWKLEI